MTDETLPIPGFCKECKYSLQTQLDPASLTRQRMCMRFPPQVVPHFTPQSVQNMTMFPMVTDSMGCFEFARVLDS